MRRRAFAAALITSAAVTAATTAALLRHREDDHAAQAALRECRDDVATALELATRARARAQAATRFAMHVDACARTCLVRAHAPNIPFAAAFQAVESTPWPESQPFRSE